MSISTASLSWGGRLWARVRRERESATFEYDPSWLENPARFSLEPALQLGPGPFHPPGDLPMFGATGDSAPDRWGQPDPADRKLSKESVPAQQRWHMETLARLSAADPQLLLARAANRASTRRRPKILFPFLL